MGFDTSKNTSILSNAAAITSTLTRILSFAAGKNLQASYQGPHSRSSAVKLEAKDMVSPKRDKMIQNITCRLTTFFIDTSVKTAHRNMFPCTDNFLM